MNTESGLEDTNKKPSYRNHYIGMLVFGWIYNIALFSSTTNNSAVIELIIEGLGAGTIYLLIGYLFTIWKGPNIGWAVIFIWGIFSFFGTHPQVLQNI